MLTIKKIVSEMDLACRKPSETLYRKPLETIYHTLNSKEQLQSYMYGIFMAAILDFTLKIYVPLNTYWYI